MAGTQWHWRIWIWFNDEPVDALALGLEAPDAVEDGPALPPAPAAPVNKLIKLKGEDDAEKVDQAGNDKSSAEGGDERLIEAKQPVADALVEVVREARQEVGEKALAAPAQPGKNEAADGAAPAAKPQAGGNRQQLAQGRGRALKDLEAVDEELAFGERDLMRRKRLLGVEKKSTADSFFYMPMMKDLQLASGVAQVSVRVYQHQARPNRQPNQRVDQRRHGDGRIRLERRSHGIPRIRRCV